MVWSPSRIKVSGKPGKVHCEAGLCLFFEGSPVSASRIVFIFERRDTVTELLMISIGFELIIIVNDKNLALQELCRARLTRH